ncbi:OmpH family outer membrane protein [Gymnodinialimonas ceratoperidinii]|uniref:OmpH family outer membrane protein n=1 Tax=Gymnodinialimonas ceratoperidinii TaxID=2856823 RepID=A0A8F6YBR3_9RHOB|nr:OmpH family outer membrane protein [Gymnodinialimonas ceratoperidinii]QXT38470.1 OmpH family outer membrane protein [Gymnodinialimonas ceratoperidinii]
MGSLSTLLRAAALGVAALVVQTGDGRAQPVASPETAILVLNQDRLLTQTEFGQRIQTELEAASQALAAENRRIEAQLTEEELDLTERRPSMTPADFRALASEFDARVVAIRAAQDAKGRDLQAQSEAAQQRFFEETFPVLLEIIEARGAAVLLDSRTVLLSAGSVDITDAAIAAINEALGDGGEEPLIAVPGVAPLEQ